MATFSNTGARICLLILPGTPLNDGGESGSLVRGPTTPAKGRRAGMADTARTPTIAQWLEDNVRVERHRNEYAANLAGKYDVEDLKFCS